MTTCTECGVGSLTPTIWEMDLRHGKNQIRVKNLECYICDQCGADPVFTDQIRRNQLKITDAKRTADGLLTGDAIRSARESMRLTQAQASELFGGGANAFSKYERGEVIQSVAMDRLIKAAQFFPGMLDFLRVEACVTLVLPVKSRTVSGYRKGARLTLVAGSFQTGSLSGVAIDVSNKDYRPQLCA